MREHEALPACKAVCLWRAKSSTNNEIWRAMTQPRTATGVDWTVCCTCMFLFKMHTRAWLAVSALKPGLRAVPESTFRGQAVPRESSSARRESPRVTQRQRRAVCHRPCRLKRRPLRPSAPLSRPSDPWKHCEYRFLSSRRRHSLRIAVVCNHWAMDATQKRWMESVQVG